MLCHNCAFVTWVLLFWPFLLHFFCALPFLFRCVVSRLRAGRASTRTTNLPWWQRSGSAGWNHQGSEPHLFYFFFNGPVRFTARCLFHLLRSQHGRLVYFRFQTSGRSEREPFKIWGVTLRNVATSSFFLCPPQVLGTPTREQIREMNPNYTEFKFPQIKAHPWTKVSQQVQEPFYFSKIHAWVIACACDANMPPHKPSSRIASRPNRAARSLDWPHARSELLVWLT